MHWWVQQYTLCAMMELQELQESTDEQNDIIEIIDIWHFIMSMLMVAGFGYDELIEWCEGEVDRDHDEDLEAFWHAYNVPVAVHPDPVYGIADAINALRGSLCNVISSLPWKHWSRKVDSESFDVKRSVVDVMWKWFILARIAGITPDQLCSVYIQKNQVNIDRQNSGNYGVAPKTEDDNRSIKV